MYQPYPGGTQVPEPSRASAPAPKTVLRAAQVMYAGAAASLIGLVIDILTRHDIRNELHTRRPKLTAAQLTSGYHAVLIGLVVGAVIAIGLWIWMALSCKAGKSWARTTSTVLFGIDTIDVIASVALPAGGGARIYGVVVWLIGLAAIILLWRPESTAFFKGTPRY